MLHAFPNRRRIDNGLLDLQVEEPRQERVSQLRIRLDYTQTTYLSFLIISFNRLSLTRTAAEAAVNGFKGHAEPNFIYIIGWFVLSDKSNVELNWLSPFSLA